MAHDVELTAPRIVIAALRETGRRRGRWVDARCPFPECDGKKGRSLSALTDKNYWKCWRCLKDSKNTRDDSETVAIPRRSASAVEADEQRLREYAIGLVDRAFFLTDGDIVDRYLRGRGLAPVGPRWPSDLRLLPSLKHAPSGTRWPAMIAAVRNVAGEIVACHRTYLDPQGVLKDDGGRIRRPGGKARVSPNRMALAPVEGHAIWLGFTGVEEEIGVTEGIESGIALRRQTGLPVLAAISANGMAKLSIPSCVKRIAIGYDRGDKNGVGLGAMQVLAYRARDRGCTTWIPPLPRIGATDPADLIDVV